VTEDPNKIEVVVNDYSALNRGVNEVAKRATLATRLLAAQVWLENVKVLFWAALVLGLLLILVGIAIFIARGDLDLSWGGTKETIRYIKVPDPKLSQVIEKTVIVEKPVITSVAVQEKIGVTSYFTMFQVAPDIEGSGISVVTGQRYPNSDTIDPEHQYCYATSDKEQDGVSKRVDLAHKQTIYPIEILAITELQANKLGIPLSKANQLIKHCEIKDFADPQPITSDKTEIPDEVKPKISASSGTGFAVNTDGYFLTNEHVVKDCDVQGLFYAGKPRKLEIIAKDDKLDLAILKSSSLKIIDYLRFSPTLATGQEIYAFGYPFLGELSKEIKVTDGIVSSLAGLKNNPSRIQITAPMQPGNSGGPVVDDKGLVIGVAVAGLAGEDVQNVNFAIKKDNVLAYLSRNRVAFEVETNASSQQTPDIVDKMKEAVFPIFCLKQN
jgi:S1-C subfamily serine protease